MSKSLSEKKLCLSSLTPRVWTIAPSDCGELVDCFKFEIAAMVVDPSIQEHLGKNRKVVRAAEKSRDPGILRGWLDCRKNPRGSVCLMYCFMPSG